ncbi:hypothetical protein X975_16463, partial [Stegodyphus mimosarum]
MKHLPLNLAVTAALFLLLPDVSAVVSKRCQSVCNRSDGQEFCQRCRMRVPMRFGKRAEPIRGDVAGQKKLMQQLTEDDDEDSRFEVPNHPQTEKENMRAEARLLLNSMRTFISDLEEWDREQYDR